ncbi:hypothetical protein [Clostridium sp. DMHC 10]|nr:hypothetical protein [Clostridium sp. DMHC 10]
MGLLGSKDAGWLVDWEYGHNNKRLPGGCLTSQCGNQQRNIKTKNRPT